MKVYPPLKNILLKAAIVSISAVTLIGCKKTTPVGPPATSLSFAMEKEIATLDPANLTDPVTFRLMGAIYESLLTLDEANKIKPCVAESWQSNDTNDVWTFTIRKGVFFHESDIFGAKRTRELTAEDVVYSISRSVAPGMISGFALGKVIDGAADFGQKKTEAVSGIKIIDDNKVEIHLTRPELYFPYRLTSPYIAIYPKEAVDQGADVFAKKQPIGTGPYKVISATDTEVTMVKNTLYRSPAQTASPEKLVFRVIQNEQLRQLEFNNGKIDVLPVTPGLLPSFITESATHEIQILPKLAAKYGVYSHADFNSRIIALQTERVAPAVRQAINVAIDREEIIRTVTFGTALPLQGIAPTGMQGYENPVPASKADPEKAKAILQSAGIVPGSVNIELLVHQLDSTERLGELLQARLKPAGINLKLRKVDFSEAMRLLIEGNFDALAMNFQFIYSSPEPILTSVYSTAEIPAPNFWRYRNEKVDQLIASYAGAKNREALNSISGQIETKVFEDTPAIFLYQARSVYAYPLSVKGLRFNGHGIPLLDGVTLAPK